jgi:serine phosphatase RsbU (regulator of sigma subunit)
MALKTIRMVSRDQPDIVTIARRLNDEIKPDLMPDQFISLFMGLVDTEERQITVLCCGHHPALVINSEGDILLRRVGKRGGAIGIADSARLAPTWNPTVLDLKAGDIVLQFTDGINETMTPNGQEFGMPRVHASLLANLENAETLSGYIEELVDDVIDFGAGKIQDDITILAFRVRE